VEALDKVRRYDSVAEAQAADESNSGHLEDRRGS